MSSLTHFLCGKVQVSLEQSEGQASSPSTTCISYRFFHLPSDPSAGFSFGLYLRLHQPYLLLSPPQQNLTAERALGLPVSQLNLSFRLLWPLLPPSTLMLPGSWCELSSNPLGSIQLSFLPWTLSLQNSISVCLGPIHGDFCPQASGCPYCVMFPLPPPLLCLGDAVSHTALLLALWALLLPCSLFSAEPVLEGRELQSHSLCHRGYLHPNPALAMKISPQMTAQPLPRCGACSQQLPIQCSSRAVFQSLEPWL